MKRRANIHFVRKMVSDELRDTLFFCTGIIAEKTKTSAHTELKSGDIVVKVNHTRSIKVNDDPCTSVWEAKYVIAQRAGLDPV